MRRTLLLLSFLALLLASCSSDTDEGLDAAPTGAPGASASAHQAHAAANEEPGEAFTFVDDDLCEWITADEVAGFVASVYDWDGTPQFENSSDLGPDECRWRLTSTAGGRHFEVRAGNGFEVSLPREEVVEYDGGDGGIVLTGETVSGHPALSEGVVVQNEGWGIYSFWVPPRDDYLRLAVNRAGRARLFALADQLLQELGWVP